MRGQQTLMSSARTGVKEQDEWRTPRWLFDRCVKEFRPYCIDAAASEANSFCDSFFCDDGKGGALTKDWVGNVWCNPPYSMLREFADRGLEQLANGNCQSATFLIPARTDTRAFQALAKYATRIVFLSGRVKFEPLPALYGGPAGAQSAPFPSAIIHLAGIRVLPRVTFEDWRPEVRS